MNIPPTAKLQLLCILANSGITFWRMFVPIMMHFRSFIFLLSLSALAPLMSSALYGAHDSDRCLNGATFFATSLPYVRNCSFCINSCRLVIFKQYLNTNTQLNASLITKRDIFNSCKINNRCKKFQSSSVYFKWIVACIL